MDELGAVEERLYAHTGRKRALHVGHALLHVVDDLVAVGAFEHHDGPAHRLAAVLREGPVAHLTAILHVVGHVAHRYGHAAGRGPHHDVTDVGNAFHHALATDKMTLVVFLDVGSARVDVVLLQGLEQVGDAHAQGVEPGGGEGYLVLLDAAAHGVHLHYAGYHRQLAPHRPVLYGAELLRRVQSRVGHQGV